MYLELGNTFYLQKTDDFREKRALRFMTVYLGIFPHINKKWFKEGYNWRKSVLAVITCWPLTRYKNNSFFKTVAFI